MNRLLSFVLLLCMLATAGCQSSPDKTSIAQTQAAQMAFLNAVAAAQTQAAALVPTATPPPTEAPAPTLAGDVVSMPVQPTESAASSFESKIKYYVFLVLSNYKPGGDKTFHMPVNTVLSQYDSTGQVIHIDVALIFSDQTDLYLAYAVVLEGFRQIYADPQIEAAMAVPATLKTFSISSFDLNMKPISVAQGNWDDVVSYGRGALSLEEFSKRVALEKPAP